MTQKSNFSRRKFIATGVSAGVMMSLPARKLWGANKNDSINLGMIGCGGRAGGLLAAFQGVEGVNVTGVCDPDQSRADQMAKQVPKSEKWSDMRDMLASDSIDAVVISTCNHWHCLAAIWAMEAGKDVYVEKPLSHTQWEGLQTVAAAERYDRICQVGIQQRSDPMQAEIKKFLHGDKTLGDITAARVNRIGIRNPIGKRDTPLEIDKNIAYDLWLGPAQDKPVFRDELQYDWHWDWNTGSGEMGNWGVHILDDVRNNVFQDEVTLPTKIFGGGGRIGWNDAGETPNLHFVHFDTGGIPVVIALTNMRSKPGSKSSPKHPGPNSGYIAYCEGGRLEGQRASATAFDNEGKVIKKFKGNTGMGVHQQNFISAVREHDATMLNADVKTGHDSTGWCNLANIATKIGGQFSFDQAKEIGNQQWQEVVQEMDSTAKAHGVQLESDQVRLSPVLELNPETEQFVGEHSEAANQLLKREYRKGFEVPELAVTVKS